MKLPVILQFAALSTALVLPDEATFQHLEIETQRTAHDTLDTVEHKLESLADKLTQTFDKVFHKSEAALDDARSWSASAIDDAESRLGSIHFAGKDWMASAVDNSKYCLKDSLDEGLLALGVKDYSKPSHGHHGHHKPNMTVFELIAKSKYTTKLAKLVSEYDDLVKLLNGTSANFTVFAPTDRAFEKIPEHAPKPSKEDLKKILTYHVSSDFYPAGRILGARTIPTLYEESTLGKGNAQRLSTNIGFKGLTINFYSRVVAANIFGTNGVIHGIDSLLVPPPKAIDVINFLPAEFSTLNLALTKTGLDKALNDTKHNGGTLFAPSNFAFSKLGTKLNAFLFSKYGLKYLKAIVEYHVVPGSVLYSDALYNTSSAAGATDHRGPVKGVFHIDLPTLLDDRTLAVDIARYGRLIEIKLNAFYRVAVTDGIVKDGVIHVVSDVLLPPKKLGGKEEVATSDLSIDELRERLDPYVDWSQSWEEDDSTSVDWEL